MPESRDAQLNPPDARPRALFHAPAKPERYVNRPEIFNRAKRLLLRDGGDRDNTVALITAFKGGSGFGKTTLAIALCHDPDVRRYFNDRVLFIGLGQQPNLLALLSDQFKLISGEREIFSDLSSAASYFRRLLSGEPILIVLDDVWDKAHAEPFLGVERAKYLITSRDLQVFLALNARGENAIEVNQMRSDEATDLLISGLTPEQRPADLTPFTAYANELGRWALLVQLASGQIASFVEYERMDALEALNEVRRQGFKLLDPQNETERNKAVSASLELSLARLGNWRACFEALAIFPEDVEVPLDAMMHLWRSQGLVQEEEEARRALRAMHRFSLFADYQLNRQRSFARLHGIIRQFLRYKQGDNLPQLHKKFLNTYKAGTWADLPSSEPYLWDHLAYHLLEAGKRDELRAALLDYRYLQAKLDARDINALLSDFGAFLRDGDDRPVRLVRQALDLSVYVLTEDKVALAHQLYSRLYAHKELGEIAVLRQQTAPRVLQPMHEPTHLQAGDYLLRTLYGHQDMIIGALELRDGRLLSWSWDKTLCLWSADGTAPVALRGHVERVNGALELRDGRLLSWSWDKTLRLWAADGTALEVLENHTGVVWGARELKDGRLLSWSHDKTLRLWAADGTAIAVLYKHEQAVLGALELGDGRLLSWSDDKTLRLWAADGTERAVLRGHEGGVNGARELRDGRLLSWAGYPDKTLRLWAADGTELAVLRGHEGGVNGARELRDGRLLSWSGGFDSDETLRLWAADGTALTVLRGHEGAVWGVRELRDGRLLSWSEDRTLRLWAADGTELAVLRGHESRVEVALELRDGRLVSCGGETLRVWSEDGTELAVLRIPLGWAQGVMELRDGRLLSCSGNVFCLWTLDGTATISTRHKSPVSKIVAFKNGRLLSYSIYDDLHCLWAADGTALATLHGHEARIRGIRELQDGRLLSWSEDKTLRLWTSDGAALAVLRGHSWSVKGALELRDGRLLSWSEGNTLRLWTTDGAALAVLRGHESWINGALELRDGRLLLWAADKTLRLWAADGTEQAVLRGHEGEVYGARELRDGRLLSWSDDGMLRLWKSDGTEIAVLHSDESPVVEVWALPSGRLLSWDDKTLRLWAADGTMIAILQGYAGKVVEVRELPDGRLISSDQRAFCLWAADGELLDVIQFNATSDELRAWFAEHTGDETAYDQFMRAQYGDSLAPSGSRRVAIRNNVLRLYNAETGEELARFYADSEITVACFTRDDVIALGCENGQVIFLQVNL